MTAIHILAGALALLAGYIALFAAKGGPLHRRAGMAFVVTMLLMGSTGALIAAVKPVRISVVAGLLVVYLVSSSWWTVKQRLPAGRGWLLVLMGLGLGVAGLAFAYGAQALQQPKGVLDGYPAVLFFGFGSFALLGALLDLRLLWAGNLQGKHRLARHLWRMELALYFAASAFFLGQAKLFPPALQQNLALLAAPVVLVLLHLAYWLIKTLWPKKPARVPATATAGPPKGTA